LNDLECPIHLKVRFTDGTLDVRTLWLLDSTIHIGAARGGGRGVGWRAYPPPCGQLTRCFSAVAELLVCRPINGVQCVLSYTYIIFMSYQKLDSYCQTFDCNVGVHGS